MGKNLWHELKHRYNVTELEVPEPQEEDVPPLRVSRKRKRGAREVEGTSAPADAEEVTSTAADASAVDLTKSPPSKESPRVAFEEVVRAAKVAGDAAEVATQAAGRVIQAAEVAVLVTEQVVPAAEARSEVPIADPPDTEQGTPASASVEARERGPSREVPPPTAAASAPPPGSSQGVSRSRYLTHRFGKGLSKSAAGPHEVGPEDSFDVAQVLLQRAMGILGHWKPRWAKQQEDLAKQQEDLAKLRGRLQPWKDANKILREENKALSVAVGEARRQEVKLRSARGDLARVQKSLEIALRSNEAYASQVGELQELVAFSRSAARSLEDEVTSSRSQVRALEDVVASLKGGLAAAAEERLRSEVILGGREDEIATLKAKLAELAAGKQPWRRGSWRSNASL
ncbi:fibrous sheath CABYR-binding protein-like [Cajanus cajan]|uniref:fibrous sheath CABYR-binding protein-like n=1 Tax=Cajanus cajan TaxID=3821 RepID=UPI00098D913A|nr:fibrous sheath CABYR-binding protein-like [Cajanus cajan]